MEKNQERKARALVALRARFEAAPLSSANLAGPEAHARALQLLLCLAGRPLAREYVPPPALRQAAAGAGGVGQSPLSY